MLTSDIRPLTSKAGFPERELESVEEVAVVIVEDVRRHGARVVRGERRRKEELGMSR